LANAGSDFQVKGGVDSNLLFIDAGVDHVGIGTNSPTRKFHVNGDYTFVHNPTTELTTSVSGYGDIVTFGTGTVSAGKLYYYSSLGQWAEADAGGAGTSTGMLAISLGSSISSGMLVRGYYRDGGITTNTGDILYVGLISGKITNTAPTQVGEVVRIVGYTINGTNSVFYFNPDNTWVEL
jgi:hypothetical protein